MEVDAKPVVVGGEHSGKRFVPDYPKE